MIPYYKRLAEDWVKHFSCLDDGISMPEEMNPYHVYELIVGFEPFWAIELFLTTVTLDTQGKSSAILAQGPLTDFVNQHASTYCDDLINAMHASAAFKEAMTKVTNFGVEPEIWERIFGAISF